jgi:nucleotide-binding universal stress UspA family protein
VVGTKGHTGLAHILLGSTAERVVQRAHCPVLCVHPEDRGGHRPIRSILVPTDFSEDAELAIASAHEILTPLDSGARLTLVHAFSMPIEYTAYGPIPTSVDYLKDAGLEAERKLFEMEERFRREGIVVETVAREGDPLVVIADVARERAVDLIAMGTHGSTGLKHFLLGSTAERVMHQAPCPVLTIRRHD